ncbi:MAG TPA: 6-phosphogluconolactonase [Opitutales bacterium]|nr:6-phosphogluconolactonase [Opitutales bacterium]
MITEYGQIKVGSEVTLFQYALDALNQSLARNLQAYIRVGLSGGRTPQNWFKWMAQYAQSFNDLRERVYWLTSDERCVALSSSESNFGNATRLMLDPLGIPNENRIPWPTELQPEVAADAFQAMWNTRFGPTQGFHVCFAGLGGDGHTLSLNPGCEWIEREDAPSFAYTRWPSGSDRLTLTPNGLARCELIIVMATGKDKADALWDIHRGPYDPLKHPAQIYKSFNDRVVWLCDEDAITRL